MKKRIMQGMLVACMLLIGFVVQAQTSSNPVGKWDYSCPDMPAEFSKGKVEFKMQNDKLTMTMTANGTFDGPPMPPLEVTKKDNSYVCKMESEYFAMTITLNPDGNNLKGQISSEMGDIAITMTPEKQ